jgi:Protein of unknown function, DUF547
MKPRLAAGIVLFSLLTACATNVPAPKPPGGRPPSPEQAEAAWARVLSERVDEAGRIDFAGMARVPADLDTYVAWIGSVSPKSEPSLFPTAEDRLAYYLNAGNALAMYNVVRSGTPFRLPSDNVRFFFGDKFLVGGEHLSLHALENDRIRPLGDPRVHFALDGIAKSGPRLPRQPFAADRLDAQLEAAAREFLNDKRRVELFPPERVVRMSMILHWYEKDFLAKAPNLPAYIDRYRPEPIPAGYEIEFLPFDWTLNTQ